MMSICNVHFLYITGKQFFQLLADISRAFPNHMTNLHIVFFSHVIQKCRISLNYLFNEIIDSRHFIVSEEHRANIGILDMSQFSSVCLFVLPCEFMLLDLVILVVLNAGLEHESILRGANKVFRCSELL